MVAREHFELTHEDSQALASSCWGAVSRSRGRGGMRLWADREVWYCSLEYG